MYFNKIRHPSNFTFATAHANQTLSVGAKTIQSTVRDLGEDVFYLELNDAQRWPLDARVLPLYDGAFDHENASMPSLLATDFILAGFDHAEYTVFPLIL